MNAIELARTCAAAGNQLEACKAYMLVLHESTGDAPEEEMEAAVYLLQTGGNYKAAYTRFHSLYNRGLFREDCLAIMTEAFYLPNVQELRGRYERNCKLLKKYPYLFRRDIPSFEELTIRFYPFDEVGYIPFYAAEERFGTYINFKNPVISRNFFKDLEGPVLADDVYSQYELEYLADNVRKSEYVGRENHIYLHYTDWKVFCAYLQCIDLRPLLKEQKVVFLIEEEIGEYPLDFKARFGVDYSRYPVRAVGVREISRLIWHTQLSSDNGGDFFNEIFDAHPNLLLQFSVMYDSVERDVIPVIRENLLGARSLREALALYPGWPAQVVTELYCMKSPTDKDILVAWFLSKEECTKSLDPAARITPAVFFQPHFSNINYTFKSGRRNEVMLVGKQLQRIHKAPMFRFKYIKTFSPMRRFTTSYGAAVRSMYYSSQRQDREDPEAATRNIVPDAISQRACNRSFMRDPDDRLYRDSVVVRFEDGKLNPRATFTALAAFLDIPYTETMTYCSEHGVRDVQTWRDNAIGFDPSTVYRTYDEWANDSERACLEFLLKDAYAFYGYDFHYYDGRPMDEKEIEGLILDFTILDRLSRETWAKVYQPKVIREGMASLTGEEREKLDRQIEEHIAKYRKIRLENAKLLMGAPYFINERRQPLGMIPLLELDPALLEQPLYQ